MCLFVEDGTIHWPWTIERGADFMGKDVLFDTQWVWGVYDTSKCANIMYSFNIASLGLIYILEFDLLIS